MSSPSDSFGHSASAPLLCRDPEWDSSWPLLWTTSGRWLPSQQCSAVLREFEQLLNVEWFTYTSSIHNRTTTLSLAFSIFKVNSNYKWNAPFGIPYVLSRPSKFEGVRHWSFTSFRIVWSTSIELKKATDYRNEQKIEKMTNKGTICTNKFACRLNSNTGKYVIILVQYTYFYYFIILKMATGQAAHRPGWTRSKNPSPGATRAQTGLKYLVKSPLCNGKFKFLLIFYKFY